MSNLAVISENALKNIPATATPAECLHITLKVLRTLRDDPEHTTHRLAVLLRGTLQKILADPVGEPEEKRQVIAALEDLKKIDPGLLKRKGQRKDGSFDLLESCTRGDGVTSDTVKQVSDDPWDSDPTRATDELVRLNEIDRQFTQYVRGEFVLRPGADMKSFLLALLDGREPSIATFTKLHNYASGRGGPSGAEVERILREQRALPLIDPQRKHTVIFCSKSFKHDKEREAMNYTDETIACVAVHFRLTPADRKYDSAANRQLIAERVQSFGVYPSPTAVVRAIAELVQAGNIGRVDGGDAEMDRIGDPRKKTA